jgi:hypothetical protein
MNILTIHQQIPSSPVRVPVPNPGRSSVTLPFRRGVIAPMPKGV